MKCLNHNDMDASAICKNCSKALCLNCIKNTQYGITCSNDCYNNLKKISKKLDELIESVHARYSSIIFPTLGANALVVGIINFSLGATLSSFYLIIVGIFTLLSPILDKQLTHEKVVKILHPTVGFLGLIIGITNIVDKKYFFSLLTLTLSIVFLLSPLIHKKIFKE